jgi:hypothetical protein
VVLNKATMTIPIGTEVKFIGWTPSNACARVLAGTLSNEDYFDKYGLKIGDRGKVSDKYHLSRVNILWTLDTGLEIIVPMSKSKMQSNWLFEIVETDECTPILALQKRCDKQEQQITELRELVNTLLIVREPCEDYTSINGHGGACGKDIKDQNKDIECRNCGNFGRYKDIRDDWSATCFEDLDFEYGTCGCV